MYDGVARRLRCQAVAGAATAVAVLAARALLSAGGLSLPADDPVGAIDGLCRLALLAADGWAWAAVLAGVVEAWRAPRRRPEAGTTRVRRWVLAACGVALTGALTTVPAHADPAPPQPTAVLSGLPMPGRALGPAHARPAEVVVQPGDSLWSISAQHLGGGGRWPALYRLNRSAIGADPDLIRPGTRLLLPTERTHR